MAHVQDRWERIVDGRHVRTNRYGQGKRWQARYLDPDGQERTRAFDRKQDAERFLATTAADVKAGQGCQEDEERHHQAHDCAGLTLLVVAAVWRASTESVHWRWSRAGFEAAVKNDELPCAGGEDCRVGWWDAERVEGFGSFTVVWTKPGCYAGQGFARPADPGTTGDQISEVLNQQAGASFTVTRWRDGWFEVCGMT